VDFIVGDKEVKDFRMIERHFHFGFVMPNSQNSVEQIYEFPALKSSESK